MEQIRDYLIGEEQEAKEECYNAGSTLLTQKFTKAEWQEYFPSGDEPIFVIIRYNPNGKYGKVIKAYECEFDAVYECNTLNRRSLLKRQYDIIYKVEKCTLHKGE